MIYLEPLTLESVKEIDEVWKKHLSQSYSVPGVENAIVDAVARNGDGRLIGYGQLKMFAEAILILDPTTEKRDRVDAMNKLIFKAIQGAEKWHLRDIYAFAKDPEFADIIVKHFGFDYNLTKGQLLRRTL